MNDINVVMACSKIYYTFPYLKTFQRVEMAMPLLEIEKELAKQRMESQLKRGDKAPLEPIDASGKATTQVAKKIGLSQATFERAVKIIEEAPEKTKEKGFRG